MIWIVRIVALLVLVFFIPPAIYFVIRGDWPTVLSNVSCLGVIAFGWMVLEEQRGT